MESIKAMAEFTEILKHNPKHAYDFIASNYYRMNNTERVSIIKELLYGIYNDCDSMTMEQLLYDVAVELDDQYDDVYQES